MIARFLASWDLFSQAYMTAWLIALLLSLVGVLVVARDQIFLGAAVSQAATLGIAVALVLSDLLPGEHFAWLRSDSDPRLDGRMLCGPGGAADRAPRAELVGKVMRR